MTRFGGVLALAIAVAGVALWWAWSPPSANELVSGDEGYYGVMGRNILADPHALVSPSLWPRGPAGDKPPLYPALLAGSMRLLGVDETGVRAPGFLLALLTILGVAFLLARAAGPWAGVAAAAMLVTLPWFADASRGAAAEIPTTAFGTLALVALVPNPTSRVRAVLAGALLGLAFLCKLWLVAPFVLACVAIVAVEPGGWRRLGWLLLGAIPVSAAHGLAVLAFAPSDVRHWLTIYFGRSLVERAGGGGYVGGWVKHPLYYWAILVHATALVFPLAVAGIEAAFRRPASSATRAILVWAACIAVLSAFAVKTGIYAYMVLPAWVGLAALGAGAVAAGRRPSWIALLPGVVASCPWMIPAAAGQRLDPALWAAAWAVAIFAWYGLARWSGLRFATVALVVLGVLGGLAREAQRLPIRYHRPGLRDLAEFVRPLLRDVPPDRVSFVSPEAPALAFYLDRTGTYWWTPQVPWSPERGRTLVEAPSVRLFVVDTTGRLYGGSPDSTTLARVASSTREITDRFRSRLGRATPLRVFVRERISR